MTGGCACGAVRYDFDAEPLAMMQPDAAPQIIAVRAASLDDPNGFRPLSRRIRRSG